MASLITVRLNRGDSPNLGFRLQGGKDFGTPLVIQKVNGGSPAERAGLIAGDAVIKINSTDVFNLRHKDAQDVVVGAGNSFDVTIQRGGSTWKPSVVTTGSYSSPTPSINNISPVTRTSLAAAKSENIGAIGTGHNLAAKPFSPQVNGSMNGGPKLVNKQYNTPMKLYSEESIAETLSAQTEVLSTGALGVNFKKNEKNYDASNSAVLRMLKESENEPNTPEEVNRSDFYSTHSHAVGGGHKTAPSRPSRPASAQAQAAPTTVNAQEGGTVCTDCERVIVGVFVRIKDKNLHVECFKCSTCGTSLKNVGYYNINNKLYCDIHAKAAAIKNNPNPNLVPITVQPGKIPAQAISSALSSHSLPSPSQLSPRANNVAPSYQAQPSEHIDVVPPLADTNGNNSLYGSPAPVSFSKFLNKASNISAGPKPFSSVSAPVAPKAAPLSPGAPLAPNFNNNYSSPVYSPVSSTEPPLGLELPKHPPPLPPVPVYTQINISIPYQSVSPQLDSKGSSPRSDYSSYSSSSGRNGPQGDSAREKVLSDIRNLTPKLKKVSLSDTQSPRLSYLANDARVSEPSRAKQKVTSELHIPVRNYRSSIHISTDGLSLPDNLTFSNANSDSKPARSVNTIFIDGAKRDEAEDAKTNPVCCKCQFEIPR